MCGSSANMFLYYLSVYYLWYDIKRMGNENNIFEYCEGWKALDGDTDPNIDQKWQ